jgi:hypothetical protein
VASSVDRQSQGSELQAHDATVLQSLAAEVREGFSLPLVRIARKGPARVSLAKEVT